LVDLTHAGADVRQRECVFGTVLHVHLAAGFLQGINLGEGGSDDDGRPDASAQHVDAFTERATEDEAENGVSIQCFLDETRGTFGAEATWL
jgi:hypothetical protein